MYIRDCIMLHKMLYNQVHVSFNNFFTLRSVISQRILPRNNDITLSLGVILIGINILLQYVQQIIGMPCQMILLVFHR